MATQESTVYVTVPLDRDLKTTGEAVFRDLGMTWATAFSALVRQTVRDGKLPFELDEVPAEPGLAPTVYSGREEFRAEIMRRVAEADAGTAGMIHVPASHFDDVDEA